MSQHFRPEFINRVDEIVVFHPLDQQQIKQIASIQIAHLSSRLVTRDIRLSVSQEALDYLASAGYDPVYGARPLKRAIQQYIENPLAQALLSGKFSSGDSILIQLENGKLTAVSPQVARQ